MQRNNTLLYVGGVGLALYLYFTSKSSPATGTPVPGKSLSITVPGAPAPPATFDKTYYLTYQYPAMLAANPNIGNPNYTLTPAEAQQYLSNYLDLQQYLQSPTAPFNDGNGNIPKTDVVGSMQYHWKTFGVAERRTFLPLVPQSNVSFVPPAVPPKPASNSSFLSSALSIASTVALFIGVERPLLSYGDVELIASGSYIAKNILPFYLQSDRQSVILIENNINQVLSGYL